jgi:para-nitrobenzyl esterase
MNSARRHFLQGLGLSLIPRLDWAQSDPRPTPPVTTRSGAVRGLDLGGVLAFKGIPYGASTAGVARFRPPQPREPWTGVRDAFDYGATAPQGRADQDRAGFSKLYFTDVAQSEDCLVLNVWTPAADRGGRPVMVWLHGGAFSSGTASAPISNGAQLARLEDVVVVSLNHRINVLGYLDVGALDPDFAPAVNVGMLDIVAALTWVRDNVSQFGGDPSRVMIFGESGGSLKVATLMAMPVAKGLFHAAAMESGAYVQAGSRDDSRQTAQALLVELGLANGQVSQLQSLPLPTLMAASAKVSAARAAQGLIGPGGVFASTVDGAILPRHPFDPAPSPLSDTIPLIIGSNRTETTYINAIDREGFSLGEDGLQLRVKAMFDHGDDARAIVASYRKSYPDASPSELYYLVSTDQWLTTASRKIAERKASAGHAPAFLYRFDWCTPVDGGKWRAPHTIEIPFVFQTVLNSGIGAQVGPTPDLALARRISGAWAALARTGNPNHPALTHWPAYSQRDRPTMIFDSDTRIEHDPGKAQRLLLDPIVFPTSGGRGDKALAVRALLSR